MPIAKINLAGEIANNLQLMLLETTKQVSETQKALNSPDVEIVEKILARDDYIDNLKSAIEKESFYGNIKEKPTKQKADIMRSIYIIANNLERIADFAVNIVRQMEYLESMDFIHRFNPTSAFKEILGTLRRINKAFNQKDLNLALRVCRSEVKLDEFFSANFNLIMKELRSGGEQTENLVTTLFILRYLERIGDSLLNIGEAIIFVIVGERVKIRHIESLYDSMDSINAKESIDELKIDSILGTKSGCRISRIQKNNGGSKESPVIFKEGKLSKIEKEIQNIEKWDELLPGLPPKVFSFQKKGRTASVLLEFLEGPTLQISLLDSSQEHLKESTRLLKKLLTKIWSQTKEDNQVYPNFMKQLKLRTSDICQAHPNFNLKPKQIGGLTTHSLEELVNECEKIEKKHPSPFSVWTHGDFNLDNIIVSNKKNNIHFIDLYRSKRQDYTQDISVFLVSIFRIPIFTTEIRERMNHFALDFLEFGRDFAKKNNDVFFEIRLALGLSRSFFTSTRFEFDKKFSQTMQQRALYLMEKIVSHKGPWEEFKIIPKVLTYIY